VEGAAIWSLPSRPDPLRCAGQDGSVIKLATVQGLSAYDAAYLELAIARSLPLATLDRKLAAAARAEKVPVLGPFGNEH